ncbi:protein diaphanous homolog 1-like [Gymnogyps californianus]|uniref:protein diaphanous homolog 1-like n=1 Tax=Gymnogyps californianus TaxID=33616 RepID=UPI0021C98F32|nr:protein diaphanous homolog 1-like [Gymnogyps californianus]
MQLINAMICPAGELDLGVPICTELMGSGLQHILKELRTLEKGELKLQLDIFEEQCGEDSEDPRIHLNDTRAQMEYPFAICWAVDQCGTGDLPGRFLSSNPGSERL